MKRTVNRMNSSFPNVVIQLPWSKTAVISILPIFLFWITKQNKTGSIMGSCNSGAHIAEGHIHSDITTCILEVGPRSAVGSASDSGASPAIHFRFSFRWFKNWRKCVHDVLVNRLGGLSLSRKNVVRLTGRPDMITAVCRGRKSATQHQRCIIEETQQTYRFGAVSNRLLWSKELRWGSNLLYCFQVFQGLRQSLLCYKWW